MNDNKPNDRHHGEQPISEPLMSMEEALAKCSALPLPEECSFIALAERMDAEQQLLQQTAEYKAFIVNTQKLIDQNKALAAKLNGAKRGNGGTD